MPKLLKASGLVQSNSGDADSKTDLIAMGHCLLLPEGDMYKMVACQDRRE